MTEMAFQKNTASLISIVSPKYVVADRPRRTRNVEARQIDVRALSRIAGRRKYRYTVLYR